jgi:hypothetical protein
MTKILVKLEADWADEFDVKAFKVYDSIAEWNNQLEIIVSLEEIYFGTNECLECLSEGDFDVRSITDDQADFLRATFGSSWGTGDSVFWAESDE